MCYNIFMVGGCSSFNTSNKELTVQNSVDTKSELQKKTII